MRSDLLKRLAQFLECATGRVTGAVSFELANKGYLAFIMVVDLLRQGISGKPGGVVTKIVENVRWQDQGAREMGWGRSRCADKGKALSNSRHICSHLQSEIAPALLVAIWQDSVFKGGQEWCCQWGS